MGPEPSNNAERKSSLALLRGILGAAILLGILQTALVLYWGAGLGAWSLATSGLLIVLLGLLWECVRLYRLEREGVAARGASVAARLLVEGNPQESRVQLLAIVESAMDAIISIDGDQRVVLFNAAAAEMFQCPMENALGQPLDRFIPARFRARHQEHVRHFGEAGVTGRRMGALGELAGLRADGQEFPIEASISRSLIAGKPVFTAIVRDITRRKRAEAQLRQAADELARSNNDLQQFAYVVSHDLQEPLRTISGFLGLLERKLADGPDAETREYMRYILEGGERMRQMIADLLAYSRVGAKDAKAERVALREPLDRALEMLRAAIDQSAAAIRVGDLPAVRADAGQWTQVFQNLIGNAIKFRSERPLEIHVGAKRDGNLWLVWVKDNGIGMSPEYRERIFEVFQRLHTQKQYPGTGIGLAICKKVVERHGGRVWVESEPGQGAAFYFTIPAGAEEPAARS
jgi:PAS domain S-box-containing protein